MFFLLLFFFATQSERNTDSLPCFIPVIAKDGNGYRFEFNINMTDFCTLLQNALDLSTSLETQLNVITSEKEELIKDKEHLGALLETARYEIDSKDLSILKHLDDIAEYKQFLSDFETVKDELALIDYQKTLLEETIKDREDQIAFLQDNLLNLNDLRSLLENQQPQEIPVQTESKPTNTDNTAKYITIIGFLVIVIIQLACIYIVMSKNKSHVQDVNFLRDAYQKDLITKDKELKEAQSFAADLKREKETLLEQITTTPPLLHFETESNWNTQNILRLRPVIQKGQDMTPFQRSAFEQFSNEEDSDPDKEE
jgi:hypothetical protein